MYTSYINRLIQLALEEDLGPGDITTDNLVSPDQKGEGVIVAKEDLIIAGLDIARQVFTTIDPDINWQPQCQDGDALAPGTPVLSISGRLAALLKGERTALNFLQRLSGIATNVRTFVETVGKTRVRLVDTRKTTPGWRILEKYAVRIGGAENHRFGLYDGVLIKDNHIVAAGGVQTAITRVRRKISHLVKIEVETSDMGQVQEALAAGADVIMLDNMAIPQIQEAVRAIAGRALVEVSGGVQKKDLGTLAATGVDIISIGALTHAARCVDLSMRLKAAIKS
jgi:nicotinate-nucleotide pyrophosphorylase (carboxylating)